MIWLSAFFILVILSLCLTIYSGVTNKIPLWIPVLLLAIAVLINTVPK